MNDRETRRYEMFGRVVTFGQTNAADFAAGGKARSHFEKLGAIITGLDREKAKQRPDGVASKAAMLDELRLDVRNITRTARAIDQDEPGFADRFPAPRTSSDIDLLTAADAILGKLRPAAGDAAEVVAAKAALVAKFVAHELPADFVADLAADRAAIDGEQDDIEGDREEGVESTAAVGRLVREGMKEVRYLDAIIKNKYARDADKLRAWQSASHIERAARRETPPAPPVPAPAG